MAKVSKEIKTFFEQNPVCVITHHWRKSDVSPAYQAAMDAPRKVYLIKPKSIKFETLVGISELSFSNIARAESDGTKLSLWLDIPNAPEMPHIVYKKFD